MCRRLIVPIGFDSRRDLIGSGELALDASGRFIALRFDWVTDQGGYIASGGVGVGVGPPPGTWKA